MLFSQFDWDCGFLRGGPQSRSAIPITAYQGYKLSKRLITDDVKHDHQRCFIPYKIVQNIFPEEILKSVY